MTGDSPVKDESKTKFKVTIGYEANGYILVPDMNVTIKDKNFVIQNHSQRVFMMDKGTYDIRFKSRMRKKDIHLLVDKNMELVIGWNRMWGNIEVQQFTDDVEYI